MKQTPFYDQLYLTQRTYLFGVVCSLLFVLSWIFKVPLLYPQIVLTILLLLAISDFVFLFLLGYRFTCSRNAAARFSNSDYNSVQLMLWHSYPAMLRVKLIEELPEQFQARLNEQKVKIPGRTRQNITYELRPVDRGDYSFGYTICQLQTNLGLVQRRLLGSQPQSVKVYPSFLQLRQFRLMAPSSQTPEAGHIRLRKIGHSVEFEHIKEYTSGDDIRTINWKATARKNNLMVNRFVDERSQQVYVIIDKGRLMKMPFNGLSLMDFAINSTLILGSVALNRQDRFGLLTFSHQMGEFVPADRKPDQLKLLQETLYRMTTQFWESDFEQLYMQVRRRIKQRSLLMLFTNFESTTGMRRQLPYLRQLAKHHLLLVVFFENTELADLSAASATTLKGVYENTIAEKFVFEKKMMVKELQQHGILCLLTPPEKLTVQAVNKYVELKTRQVL